METIEKEVDDAISTMLFEGWQVTLSYDDSGPMGVTVARATKGLESAAIGSGGAFHTLGSLVRIMSVANERNGVKGAPIVAELEKMLAVAPPAPATFTPPGASVAIAPGTVTMTTWGNWIYRWNSSTCLQIWRADHWDKMAAVFWTETEHVATAVELLDSGIPDADLVDPQRAEVARLRAEREKPVDPARPCEGVELWTYAGEFGPTIAKVDGQWADPSRHDLGLATRLSAAPMDAADAKFYVGFRDRIRAERTTAKPVDHSRIVTPKGRTVTFTRCGTANSKNVYARSEDVPHAMLVGEWTVSTCHFPLSALDKLPAQKITDENAHLWPNIADRIDDYIDDFVRSAAPPLAEKPVEPAKAWYAGITSENALRVRMKGTGWMPVLIVEEETITIRNGDNAIEPHWMNEAETDFEVQLIDGAILHA